MTLGPGNIAGPIIKARWSWLGHNARIESAEQKERIHPCKIQDPPLEMQRSGNWKSPVGICSGSLSERGKSIPQ